MSLTLDLFLYFEMQHPMCVKYKQNALFYFARNLTSLNQPNVYQKWNLIEKKRKVFKPNFSFKKKKSIQKRKF